ncbi:hypothetical protein H6768_04750 [Candidatus Peribacteria bacterium]|nr:hypothetical protein [Candidatus Peribacteria bacterium]
MNVGNLFVLNQVSNSMTVIDLSVDLVESNVKIDDEYGDPESLLLYGSKVYILSTKNSKISIFNKYNNVVTKAIAVPANPIKAIRVDTKVYVLHRGNGVISVIDASKEKLIDTIILSAPGDDFYLANNNLYIIQKDYNTVSVIDTSSIAIKKTVGAVIPV